MQTVNTFFDAATTRYAARPALLTKPRYRTEVWSYAHLRRQADRVTAAVLAQGIKPGERVVLWGPNSPWWVAAYFGCLRAGAILVPLDVLSAPDYVRRVLEQTEPVLALLSRTLTAGWEYPAPAWYLEELDDRLAGTVTGALPDVQPDQPVEILYTSGTTGTPKGVILTHANLMANLIATAQVSPRQARFRLLSLLPLSHMLEQMAGLLLPMHLGASIYYPSSKRPTLLLRDLREQRITTIIGVPQVFALFMRAIEQEVQRRGQERVWRALQRVAPALPMAARRLLFRPVYQRLGGSLSLLFSGGAALDPDLMRKWEAIGIPVRQAFGATEASPAITVVPQDDRRPGSVGLPVPGVRLRIADDGEVLVQGANITPGYWRDAAATAAAFEDGWYRTGDLGYLDIHGHLRLRGRKNDLIVRANGQNVYPEDVERELLALPGVLDAVVLRMPDPRGEQVHAVLRCEGAVAAADVVRQANRILAPHQQIGGYTVWPHGDFPRTHTLKVRKAVVLQALLDGTAPEPPPPARQAPTLAHLVAEVSGRRREAPRPTDTLGELGLDSLGRTELLALVEHELGVYLDETAVGPDTSLVALETLLREHAGGARAAPPRWPLSPWVVRVRMALYRAAFLALNALCPAEVTGRDALRGLRHPVIFAVNHVSSFDPLVLLSALSPAWRRRIAVVTADKYFANPLLGTAMGFFFNSVRLLREGNIRPTLEHAAWLLDQRWSLILFPEGTRSADGRMGPCKPGIGLLAVELGVPVVPVYLHGMYEVLPRHRRVPRHGAVALHLGPALRFAPGDSPAEAAQAIEAALHRLADRRALDGGGDV